MSWVVVGVAAAGAIKGMMDAKANREKAREHDLYRRQAIKHSPWTGMGDPGAAPVGNTSAVSGALGGGLQGAMVGSMFSGGGEAAAATEGAAASGAAAPAATTPTVAPAAAAPAAAPTIAPAQTQTIQSPAAQPHPITMNTRQPPAPVVNMPRHRQMPVGYSNPWNVT